MKHQTLLIAILFCCSWAWGQEVNPNGYNKFFYPNGQLASEGNMKTGKPDGFWKNYYDNGQLKSEGKRTNFQLDSIWIFYSTKGDTLQRIPYQGDKKNGYAIEYQEATDSLQNLPIAIEYWMNDVRDGKAKYFYPSGKLKEVVVFIEGMRQGKGKVYNEQGQVIALNLYKNNFKVYQEKINRRDRRGFRTGLWRDFHPNGRVATEYTYKNDKLHGYLKNFNKRGRLLSQKRYDMGELVKKEEEEKTKVTIKQEFFPGGGVKEAGGYLQGVPVGVHRVFDETGKVIASKTYTDKGVLKAEGKVLKSGRRSGNWKNIYPSGSIKSKGKYKKGRKHGKWDFYFPNGKQEQVGAYLAGKYDGMWTWYYPTGEVWREEEYFKGKREGTFVEYAKSGAVISKGKYIEGEREEDWILTVGDHSEQGNYLAGLRNGGWKYFYTDGMLKFEGNFVDGAANGKHKYYWPNGKQKEIRQYVAGQASGKWKSFDTNGNIIFELEYKAGKEWKVDGVLIQKKKD